MSGVAGLVLSPASVAQLAAIDKADSEEQVAREAGVLRESPRTRRTALPRAGPRARRQVWPAY